jgi:3'(2'), 5'-bisphosphate nucleotidase
MEDRLVGNVEDLLRRAGDAIMQVYTSRNFGTMHKSDDSPVTKADRISSQLINAGLAEWFPSIPVIDEENLVPDYAIRRAWKTYFLLDPLDGTKEFINRNGEFCINLALMENNLPVLSWIYQPVEERGWFCRKGAGIFNFGGSPATYFQSIGADKKLRLVTSRSHPSRRGTELIRRLGLRYELEIVRLGSALKQVEVALGFSGVYARGSGCSEWDTAAGQLMIEESGGLVFQWDMLTPLEYNKPNLVNPPFVMISKQWQTTEFQKYMQELLSAYDGY